MNTRTDAGTVSQIVNKDAPSDEIQSADNEAAVIETDGRSGNAHTAHVYNNPPGTS